MRVLLASEARAILSCELERDWKEVIVASFNVSHTWINAEHLSVHMTLLRCLCLDIILPAGDKPVAVNHVYASSCQNKMI
jgi:hypothetical protein